MHWEGREHEVTIRGVRITGQASFTPSSTSRKGRTGLIRLQIFAGACIAFVFPMSALAATEPAPHATPSAAPEPQVIGSVTVTADRHPEAAIRSTRPTYVVTEEQMRARGYHTVGDALTQVPGANVLRYGGIGAQENVLLPGSNETTTYWF